MAQQENRTGRYLDDNECYVADARYYNGRQWAETTTGYNNHEQKCMLCLGHIMKLLTDASNSVGACRIPTGIHYIGMEK